jgi:flagellar biosynthetic protein FlhB
VSDDESGEKVFDPSERKLDEARRKGEVSRSTDLNTAASYAAVIAVFMVTGSWSLMRIGETGAVLLEQSVEISELMLSSASAPTGGILAEIAWAVSPVFVFPGIAVFLSLVAQRALTFAPEKLIPKGQRVSILANVKNKFGRSGLFEFAKSCVKLVLISIILWTFLLSRLPRMIGALNLDPTMASVELLAQVVEFLVLVVVTLTVIGGVDYFWQRAEHLRKNRMSHQDMREEHKQSEGDPHAKQQRRQRGYEIATRQMLVDVHKADVIIVNPTHYAVALKWDRTSVGAPICLAKGADEIAARIRERAHEAKIPIHSDPPTARALHATAEIGQEISPDHYQAVAAAIRFSEAMRQKAAMRVGVKR